MAKFRVEIDKVACQSFGACVELCSNFFQLSEVDGKSSIQGSKSIVEGSEVVKELLEVDELNCIKDAAEACPFIAIHITNIQTGEKLI
jgi:ferredoxin